MREAPAPARLSRPCAEVLDALREQPGPTGIAALAELTGRHPNTVREHLTWLLQTGLAVRHPANHDGRGRPAWLYEAVGPRPGPADQADLAAALALLLAGRGEDSVADAVAAGRRSGRELSRERGLAPEPGPAAGREQVVALLDDLGFAPDTDESMVRLRLTRCPLLHAAYANPQVVCALHVGLVQGVLDVNGAPVDGVELLPFSEPGACTLVLSA